MKARILVVEDNPADAELLKWALRDADVDVEMTLIHDGADALAYIRGHGGAPPPPHELAVLDLNVPKHDGLEILETMRATTAFRDLPVVILTSSWSPRERSRLVALGVTKIIGKPLDLDEFMRIGPVLRELLTGPAES